MNFGLNFSAPQFVTWKEEDSLALAASVLVSVAADRQFVAARRVER